MTWKKLAALVGPLTEEQLGVLSEVTDLEVGDRVVVTTKLGRRLASGSVAKVVGDSVTVNLDGSGIAQIQVFSSQLYSFHKIKAEESANLVDGIPLVHGTGSTAVQGNTNDIALPGKDNDPDPRHMTIMDFLGVDIYQAVKIWSDIMHLGFKRAMRRHGLPVDSALGARLLADGAIKDLGHDSPEARPKLGAVVSVA